MLSANQHPLPGGSGLCRWEPKLKTPSPAFTHRKEHSKQTSLQPVTGELLTLDSIMIVTTVSISAISSGTGRQGGRRDLRKVTGGFHAVPPAVRAVAESPPTVRQGARRRLFSLLLLSASDHPESLFQPTSLGPTQQFSRTSSPS